MVGQNIGKYRVIDRIGRGGMGTVYRALDETLHREVAIKVLNAELNDPEVAKRFRAEAITVARLSHPGIATIYELFQNDGQWLMVMEFVRGETLEHMVDRMGPLSPQRTAELCMQTLAALAHAHSMGVVHRDLKPANVMITETGAIKVMDFGIARVAGTEHLTSAGFMMGTPAYMAPEQVMGHEIDARADLYAMGVVFYRLTTAKLPFKGETPFAMAQSQVNDPPTPIGMVRSDLPSWVEQVVVRSLAKNPEERFQSAVEFHESLARCLAGLPMRTEYGSSAPTELLMTPSRAMPTGSLRTTNTLPPMTGAPPPPSGAQPLATPAVSVSGEIAAPPPPPAVPSAPMEFDESAATTSSPASGALRASPSTSAAVPLAASMSGAVPAVVSSGAVRATSVSAAVPATAVSGTVPVAEAISTGAISTTTSATAAAPVKKKGSGGLVAVLAVLVIAAAGGGLWLKSRHADVAPVAAPADTAQAAPAPDAAATAPAAAPADGFTATSTTSSAAKPLSPNATVANGASSPATSRASSTPAGAVASSAAATPASGSVAGRGAAPMAEEAAQSFPDARVLLLKGRKSDDEEVSVNFEGGVISAVAKKGQRVLASLPFSGVGAATDVHARDPKWSSDFSSPPQDLDVGGMLRTAKHWLVVQSKDTYLILRLDDSNWRAVLQALTARTGVVVSTPKTTDK